MKPISRRNFIKVGSSILTIPFLESLYPHIAQAQSASGSLKRVMFYCLSNGWYDDQVFPASTAYLTGAEGVRYIPLSSFSGNISPLFTSAKYSSLKSKMNIMRGFDLTESAQGGHDMKFALCASSEGSSTKDSIDTVIINSSQFYPSTPFRKSLNALPVKDGNSDKYNFSFQNGNSRSLLGGPSAIFSDFFSGSLPSTGGGGTPTTPVDTNLSRRVAMESTFNKLTSLAKSTSLSTVDQQNLDKHATMIQGLLKTLGAPTGGTSIAVGGGCAKPTVSSSINQSMSSSSGNQARLRACMDQIYMAFNCQLTNMAVLHPVVAYDTGNWDMGDTGNDNYHQLAGHHYEVAKYLMYKGWVLDQLVYLLNLMDGTKESNGLTMLDNSLVVVIANDSCSIHGSQDIPVITFGSLGGSLKTGNYINYQRPDAPSFTGEREISGPPYYHRYNANLGRPLASLYTTILNALKIPHSGFGSYGGSTSNYSQFVSAAGKQASLPILT